MLEEGKRYGQTEYPRCLYCISTGVEAGQGKVGVLASRVG